MGAQFALIGHSGAGKSSCLKYLGFSDSADMDKALGTDQKPSLSSVVEWLSEQRVASSEHRQAPSLVALSIHGPWKEWFNDMKSTGVTLVYLCKPKQQLKQHLSKRPEWAQECTLNQGDSRRFH